ncbi:MAG: divalent-cation tolerance protein CutA [Verrucomicrobiae bacterium]
MIRVVLCTFPDEVTAAEAVRTLVSENLAACGTLLPGARSIYCWEGKIEDAREVVVIFKISTVNEKPFAARLVELHPYDVPEIISLTPSHVHEAYAQWVDTKFAPADPRTG